MSDVEITKISGLLDLFESGDDVMADKGFTIRKILWDKGLHSIYQSFLVIKDSSPYRTEQVAKLRIHIERMNRRIKEGRDT